MSTSIGESQQPQGVAVIPRTQMLHVALRDVAQHDVDFYPGLIGGHPRGYGWHGGGDIPQGEQDALAELEVVHLIGFVPARIADQIGSEVVLTPEGERALSMWDALGFPISPARGAGVLSRAGDTNGGAE